MNDLPVELAKTGSAAPPRSNGELVFEAPWEGRVFGLAIALYEADCFEWSEFQQRLISAVGRWEAEHPDGEGYRYYERWSEALETLLDERGIVAVDLIHDRAAALAARPAGHDHGQRDHHDHHGRRTRSAAHDGG